MRESNSRSSATHRAAEAEGTFRRDIDAIREDLNTLREDLATAMHDLIDAGRSGTADAKHRVKEVVREKLESISEAVEGLGDRTKRMYNDFSGGVERNPVRSVAIAAGIGAVVGAVVTSLMGCGRR